MFSIPQSLNRAEIIPPPAPMQGLTALDAPSIQPQLYVYLSESSPFGKADLVNIPPPIPDDVFFYEATESSRFFGFQSRKESMSSWSTRYSVDAIASTLPVERDKKVTSPQLDSFLFVLFLLTSALSLSRYISFRLRAIAPTWPLLAFPPLWWHHFRCCRVSKLP